MINKCNETDRLEKNMKKEYKKQFDYWCKKFNIGFNQEMFEVYCYDQQYKKEHKMATNGKNCIEILLDMIHSQYDLPLMERYIKFKSFPSKAYTLERNQLRYGLVEGKKKWDEYCHKQAKSNLFEYKHEKYGWTEEEYDAYNKSRAVTLENQIKKHGEEGKKLFEEYCKKQSYVGCKKEYFIEKYGEEEGQKRYDILSKQKSLTESTFIEKYGEEEGKKRYKSYREKLFKSKKFDKAYSMISQDLFDKLRKLLNDNENVFYATFGGEVPFYNMKADIGGYIDFVYKNKVIEFYGDYWHLNPNVLNEDKTLFRNGKKLTMNDVHEIDMNRINLIKEDGYDILIIWENDYRNNEENVIKQCMRFLNDKDN